MTLLAPSHDPPHVRRVEWTRLYWALLDTTELGEAAALAGARDTSVLDAMLGEELPVPIESVARAYRAVAPRAVLAVAAPAEACDALEPHVVVLAPDGAPVWIGDARADFGPGVGDGSITEVAASMNFLVGERTPPRLREARHGRWRALAVAVAAAGAVVALGLVLRGSRDRSAALELDRRVLRIVAASGIGDRAGAGPGGAARGIEGVRDGSAERTIAVLARDASDRHEAASRLGADASRLLGDALAACAAAPSCRVESIDVRDGRLTLTASVGAGDLAAAIVANPLLQIREAPRAGRGDGAIARIELTRRTKGARP